MIPPDVASSLRSVLTESQNATQQPQQTQPVAAIQRIADVLGNLVPGQRIMAEIQGMQANGTYRAMVGQREITLSLPFSAKAGDSLELEVTESEGKLTLAFVANRGEQAAKGQLPVSVATSLSNAGRMIGDLLQDLTVDGKRAPAAPLNGNQALVQSMPKEAAQLVPILKQALTQSGMFYEAHQARWAAGRLPTEQLRQEPQGRLPVTATPPSSGSNAAPTAPSPAPQSQPGQTPAATAFPGGSAASTANALPDSAGSAAKPAGNVPRAHGNLPTPMALAGQPGDSTPPAIASNLGSLNSPPPASGQAPVPPQAQTPPAQAAMPPEVPSGAGAPPPQNPSVQPSVAANAAQPALPVPANSATQGAAPQATAAQTAPGMPPPAAARTPPPAANSTASLPAPPPTPGPGSPGARPGTAYLPPLIRQGNLIYEAFPPRNAWLTQGIESQGPANLPPSASAPPSAPAPSLLREGSGQPGLTSTAEPSQDTAAIVKSGSSGLATPAESNRNTALPPGIATPAAGTERTLPPGLPASPPGIPRDIAPLVQQQLDGLANQNYAWQGQIWPGQNLWWEIGEDPESRRIGDEEGKRWQTRLKLTLPILGDVDARISLQGSGQISLRLGAGDAVSATQLQERLAELRQQFETAGLSIGLMRVDHEPLPQTEPAA